MTSITPLDQRVLELIQQNNGISVIELVDQLQIDRGKLEGSIGNLELMKIISKNVSKAITHRLTERGMAAAEGLAERKIIDILLNDSSVTMNDLTNRKDIKKSDITAGIGVLRKANLVTISKGRLSLNDIETAKDFSLPLLYALADLKSNKSSTVNEDIAELLIRRGFIEEIESSSVNLAPLFTKNQIAKLQILEEVSNLTPQMLASGDWKSVSFKPYSLDTKPRTVYAGRFNPYKQFLDHLRTKLIGLGFQEMKGPMIEQEFWNFDSLYAAQDHASREDSDILLVTEPTHGKLLNQPYVKNVAKTHEDGWKTGSKGFGYKWDPAKAARLLLRPHGTAISARTMPKVKNPPAKFFSIARCFRPDHVDATHDVEFDQTEGIILDESITFRDLLGMLETFAVEVAGATEVRFRPDYYPFTSPSVELSAKHPVLGYVEFGGAGIFRPEVTQPFGIDYPVLAWGLGVGRLFMTKYNISDIRELFSQNLQWLREEKVSSGIQLEGDKS